MSKAWKTRLTETWTYIDSIGAPAPQVAALKLYHANLTDAQRKTVSEAMAQGKYTAGVAKATEKGYRHFRRALILILMAKSNSGTVANDLQRAQAALQANITGDMAEKRVKSELADLATAVTMMHARGAADLAWAGWDGAMQRPLLAGCGIGRRGANGPGTLGCFVTRGPDVFILSNRHVLYQAGGIAPTDDMDVIQPPHQLGGSYFDVVASTVEDDPVHDAAIARVKSGIVCNNVTPEGLAIAGSNAVGAINTPVTKRGCASRARCGLVTNANSANVNANGTILQDQLLVQRDDALDAHPARIFQIQGDSGAVLLNAANEVVALMHGQADAVTGQATHIGPILAHFGVAVLVGQRVAP